MVYDSIILSSNRFKTKKDEGNTMGKSINRSVWIRVACALLSVLLFSVMITVNIIRIDRAQEASKQSNALLSRCHQAETAHYKWSSNLSSALYASTEFTGSTQPDTCVLGQWIYGEAGTTDPAILSLRAELEPLHKELHESAVYVLDLKETSPVQARLYYQETIQSNLTTLVGKLDRVVELLGQSTAKSEQNMSNIISVMHATTVVGLTVSAIGFCTQQAKERWAVARVALLEYLAQVTGDARNAERRAVQ